MPYRGPLAATQASRDTMAPSASAASTSSAGRSACGSSGIAAIRLPTISVIFAAPVLGHVSIEQAREEVLTRNSTGKAVERCERHQLACHDAAPRTVEEGEIGARPSATPTACAGLLPTRGVNMIPALAPLRSGSACRRRSSQGRMAARETENQRSGSVSGGSIGQARRGKSRYG